MEHTIVYSAVNAQIEKLRNSCRGWFVRILFQFLLPLTTFGQINPWEQKPHGENPWGTAEKTIQVTPTSDTSSIAPKPLVNNASLRAFVLNNDTVLFNTADTELIKYQLELYGKNADQGNAPAIIGTTAGLALNFIGLPIGLISGLPETKGAKACVQEFKESNPTATKQEIKYVQRGLQSKRIAQSFLGAVGGFLVSTVTYVTLIITSF